MGFPKMDEQKAIQEAASESLKGMEHMIRLLSHQPNHIDCTDLTDVTVYKFKKLIHLLNRTGHARFRRAPLPSSSSPSTSTSPTPPPAATATAATSSATASRSISQSQTLNMSHAPSFVNPVSVQHHAPSSIVAPQSLTLDFTKPNNILTSNNTKSLELEFSKETFSVSSNSSFMSSAITGDGSVSNGKQGSSIFLTPAAPTTAASGGKPPLSTGPHGKKRCHDHRDHHHSDDVSGSSKCHCVKRRYVRHS